MKTRLLTYPFVASLSVLVACALLPAHAVFAKSTKPVSAPKAVQGDDAKYLASLKTCTPYTLAFDVQDKRNPKKKYRYVYVIQGMKDDKCVVDQDSGGIVKTECAYGADTIEMLLRDKQPPKKGVKPSNVELEAQQKEGSLVGRDCKSVIQHEAAHAANSGAPSSH